MELYSHDAEASLVGAAMLDNDAVPELSTLVRPEDFQEPAYRTLWAAIINLVAKGQAADAVTVSEHLEAIGQGHEVGGLAGVAELVRQTPSATNAATYAGIVGELAQRREIIAALLDVETAARDRDVPLHEIASQARGRVEACLRAGHDRLPVAGDVLKSVIDTLDRRFTGAEEVMGLSTGIKDLDDRILGLRPGLTILAARPSMGKTAMMLQWLAEAGKAGAPALCASLEMPRDALMERLVCNVGNLPLAALKNPRDHLEDEHWPRITAAVNILKDAPLYIDDRAQQDVAQVRARAKEIHDRHGRLGLICVDYVQKMHARGDYGRRHDRAMEEVIVGLNDLGKEYGCPVVVLSQLNRQVEQRADKRPVMSDLKESSAFEQEADVILFLYRDEVYHPDNPDSKGLAEVIAAKQREGEIGTTHCVSRLSHARFEALAPRHFAGDEGSSFGK